MAAGTRVDRRQTTGGAPLSRHELRLVALLTLAGLALCLVRIGHSSLWLDEAFSVAGSGELARSWTERGGSMGLYYSFLAVWTDATGSPTWVRLPSAVFAAGSVPFVYLTARRVGGRRVAVTTSVLLITSWGFVRYGQEARSYSLVLLLVSASWWFFVRLLDDPRPGWRVMGAYVVVTGLVGYAHPFGLLVVAPQLFPVVLRSDLRESLRRAIPAFGGVALATVPLVVLAMRANASPNWVQPLNLRQLEQLQVQLGGSVALGRWAVALGLVAGAVILVRRLFDPDASQQRWIAAIPVAWCAGPIVALAALSLVDPHFVARYLLGVTPAACMLVAVALASLPRSMGLVAVTVMVGVFSVGVLRLWDNPRQDWQAVVAHVVDIDDRPLILFADPELRVPFEHALLVSDRADGIEPLAPPLRWGDMPRHLPEYSLDESPPLESRVWVVDWGHSPDDDPLTGRIAPIAGHPAFEPLCPTAHEHFAGSLVAVRFDPSPGGC